MPDGWVKLDLSFVQQHFPDLQEPALSREGGAIAYRLRLPSFPSGREFAWVELRLPRGFPDHARAEIIFSPDAVLRLPHLDSDGVLCSEGEPGPGQGYSPAERILFLLRSYQEQFLKPWLNGTLDGNFAVEALNYWAIEVARARSSTDPVRTVWMVDPCPDSPTVRGGLLLLPNRAVIAADEELPITNRLIRSMGNRANQRVGLLLADIPISHTFTPDTWPRSESDLAMILNGRLTPADLKKFLSARSRRGRSIHRVVLLRNAEAAFAYLLPGGPPTLVDNGKRKKTYPSRRKPLPLNAMRLDPAWTVGRDQHPEVASRQLKRILVFGAGALGSPIVDHLAKAGVGLISVVDTDKLSAANIGRHLLGADFIGTRKAEAVAQRINLGYPATLVKPFTMTAEAWLRKHSIRDIDLIVDLTGEPDVRWHVDQARAGHPCPLLIGWMEPYVAAAHVCLLPGGTPWMQGNRDPMKQLEAIEWPDDVMRNEPGCSSQFQSYTPAAAAHAVALVAENVLDLVDGTPTARVVSWVRGQRFLDKHRLGLVLRDWALSATSLDGVILTRSFP